VTDKDSNDTEIDSDNDTEDVVLCCAGKWTDVFNL
jgi:hypothetical protein